MDHILPGVWVKPDWLAESPLDVAWGCAIGHLDIFKHGWFHIQLVKKYVNGLCAGGALIFRIVWPQKLWALVQDAQSVFSVCAVHAGGLGWWAGQEVRGIGRGSRGPGAKSRGTQLTHRHPPSNTNHLSRERAQDNSFFNSCGRAGLW